jgi:hypothetical protein
MTLSTLISPYVSWIEDCNSVVIEFRGNRKAGDEVVML